ncbi:MAG TPA: DUF1080 domain-containing protein [Pirellulales bacterium]
MSCASGGIGLGWIYALAVAALASFLPGPDPVAPFNGKSLDGWKFKGDSARSHWQVGQASLKPDAPNALAFTPGEGEAAELVNVEGQGVDVYTEAKFGDVLIELEFMLPKGSNSGVYVMGEYEVQIFDSFGKTDLGQGDLGAIYSVAAPKTNLAKAPGEWQTLSIEFQAPRFDGETKTANAKFVKVILNGQTLHENLEIAAPTPSCITGRESPTGPLMLQGDHGPVAYRRIKITPR